MQSLDMVVSVLRGHEGNIEALEARNMALEARLEVAMMHNQVEAPIAFSSGLGLGPKSDRSAVAFANDKGKHPFSWQSCALFGENDENCNSPADINDGASPAHHPDHTRSGSRPLSPALNRHSDQGHNTVQAGLSCITTGGPNGSSAQSRVTGVLIGTPSMGRRMWASNVVLASPKVQLMDTSKDSKDFAPFHDTNYVAARKYDIPS